MANVNAPRGFLPINWPGHRQELNRYRISTTNNAMAMGDLVKVLSDGTIDRAGAGATTIVGVVMHFEWEEATTYIQRKGTYFAANLGGGPTSDTCWAYVADNPSLEFVAQADSGGSVACETSMFQENCDHVDAAPTKVSEYGGHSNQEIDISLHSSAAQTLRLVKQFPVEGNDFGSSTTANLNGKFVVRILEHFLNGIGADAAASTPAAGV